MTLTLIDDELIEKTITNPEDGTDNLLESMVMSHGTSFKVKNISMIKEPLWVGLGYWNAWLENGSEYNRKQAVENLLVFRSEVLRKEKQLKEPAQSHIDLLVDTNECDIGVIRDINPNKEYSYGTGEGKYLLKMLSVGEANRNYQDWLTCFATDSRINLTRLGVQSAEILRKPLPINDKDAFILQEDLIGPSNASILSMLNKISPNDPRADKIRETIVSHRIHEYMSWRDHVPTLMSQKNYSMSNVIDGYVKRWTHFFKNFGQYNGTNIPEDQIEEAKNAINSFPWTDIIKQDTLMRYFSGTFRNSVIKTNKVNISADELIARFSKDGQVDTDEIKRNMFTIDHGAKDSQRMEDACEIINNPHAGLSEDKKLEYWGKIGHPDPYRNQEALVMMIYRNCRVADLFMNNYLMKIRNKNRVGVVSNEQLRENEQLYIKIIQEQIYQAIEMTNKLYQVAPHSPLIKLAKPLETCLKKVTQKL